MNSELLKCNQEFLENIKRNMENLEEELSLIECKLGIKKYIQKENNRMKILKWVSFILLILGISIIIGALGYGIFLVFNIIGLLIYIGIIFILLGCLGYKIIEVWR